MSDRTYDTRIDANRGNARREYAAVLGMLAIVCNLFGALLLSAQPIFPNANAFDPFGDRQTICSSNGMIVLDRDGNPVSGQPVGHAPHCIFCLPLMHGDIVVPVVAIAVLVWVFQQTFNPSGDRQIADTQALLDGLRARGPPLT